jgi:hypothetical protein
MTHKKSILEKIYGICFMHADILAKFIIRLRILLGYKHCVEFTKDHSRCWCAYPRTLTDAESYGKHYESERGKFAIIDANKAYDKTYGDIPDWEYEDYEDMRIECYECHEVINFTEDDVIENWYVKCPRCGEEISILP